MRRLLALALCGLVLACEKRPAVYERQIAACDDNVQRSEQMRSVSGHDDDTDLQRKKDAVALAEYFVDHCFPKPYDPPAADEPGSGTVGQIIDYQRKVHNKKQPYNPI